MPRKTIDLGTEKKADSALSRKDSAIIWAKSMCMACCITIKLRMEIASLSTYDQGHGTGFTGKHGSMHTLSLDLTYRPNKVKTAGHCKAQTSHSM